MPNIKIYVDDSRYDALRQRLSDMLPDLRTLICRELQVAPAACQFAVVPVLGLAGQPSINAELHVLPHPLRTRRHLSDMGAALRDRLAQVSGLEVAVRIALLDAATYVALK